MRSVLVVVGQPVVSDGLNLFDGVEQVGVEHFRSEFLVEPFDVGVLVGLARLDVVQSNAFVLGPFDEVMACHLGTVVHAN